MSLVLGLEVSAADIAAAEDLLASMFETVATESELAWSNGMQVTRAVPATVETTFVTWIETSFGPARAASMSGRLMSAAGSVAASGFLEFLGAAGIAYGFWQLIDGFYGGMNPTDASKKLKLECALEEWKGGGGVVSCRKVWADLIDFEETADRKLDRLRRSFIGSASLMQAYQQIYDKWIFNCAAEVRRLVFSSPDNARRYRRRHYSRRN